MFSLDDRQRRELWGLALALLALLLALSLVPVGILGAVGDRFAAGNIVGVLGAALRDATAGFLGGLEAEVPEGTIITIVPAVSGG